MRHGEDVELAPTFLDVAAGDYFIGGGAGATITFAAVVSDSRDTLGSVWLAGLRLCPNR